VPPCPQCNQYTARELEDHFWPLDAVRKGRKIPASLQLPIHSILPRLHILNPDTMDKNGDPLYIIGKYGSATKFTLGHYSGIEGYACTEFGLESREVAIYNHSKTLGDFSNHGDSGSLIFTHWGQRGSYLAGTLWVCWEFLSNLLILCPAGKLRVLLKLTHHFDLNVISGYIVIKLKMSPSNYPAGILWMNLPGSFTILIKMYPQFAWATHWEFFQRIPSYLISMYSTIYSMSSLRVCGKIEPHWEFVMSSSKRTHWVH